MEDRIFADIKHTASTVKINVDGNKMEYFITSILSLIDLAKQIDTVSVSTRDNSIFFNFPFQSLELWDGECESITPKFYRPTIDNMIVIPRFVG